MIRILALFVLIAACDDRPEQVRIVDRNGHLAATLQRRSGIKDGPVTLFWPDGTERLVGNFQHDRREGWWRGYHVDGSLRSLTHYANGQKEGRRIYWDSSGRPVRLEVFAHGLPNGPFYRYFPDGRLEQQSNYVDGQREGPHDQWYDDRGGTRVNGYYHAGQEMGLWTEYDTLGHMIWQAYLNNGEVTRMMYGIRRRH